MAKRRSLEDAGYNNILVYNSDEDYYTGKNTKLPDITIVGRATNKKKGLYPVKYRYNPNKWVSARTKQLTADDVAKAYTAATVGLLPNYISAASNLAKGNVRRALSDAWLYNTYDGDNSNISYGVAGFSVPEGSLFSSAKTAAKATSKEWTAAQDAAIARGDWTEAQRLRDLHFETIGSPVRTQEGSMRLTHATKNRFNSFDLSKAGSGSGNTSNTEGVIHLSPYDDAALDVFKTKSPEERSAYNLIHIYANNPKPVEVPLEEFLKTFNDREAFIKLRDAGDGIIARGMSPYKLYEERLAEYESKKAAGKLMPWTRKPESPKDFMGEDVVDGYTINNPKNLKSADAVTYDNNGVRIPLGKRDNFKLNDIRYSWLAPFIGLGTLGTLYGASNKRNLENNGYK